MISLQPKLHTIYEDVTIWRVQDMMIYDDVIIWRYDDKYDKYDFGLSWYYEILIVYQAAKVDLVLTYLYNLS